MNSTIRVLVVMAEAVVREQLRILLSLTNDIRLVGEAMNIQQWVHGCLTLQPALLLLDGGLKPFVFDLAALTAQISPPPKVIALLNSHDLGRAQALLVTNLAGALLRQEIR